MLLLIIIFCCWVIYCNELSCKEKNKQQKNKRKQGNQPIIKLLVQYYKCLLRNVHFDKLLNKYNIN